MRVILNLTDFKKDMKNITQYSYGFLDGVERGKKVFLTKLGMATIQALAQYIDAEARANPRALHHVYEWYQTGSPQARLFDLNYVVSGLGLSVNATFSQSRTVQVDSNEPFYNKARIMENGIPVVIRPKKTALRFNVDGREVFTRKSVTVEDPGGTEVQGAFEKTMNEFFLFYFSQAFLRSSGILNYLKDTSIYRKNIHAGARTGRSVGVQTGYKWISTPKIGVE